MDGRACSDGSPAPKDFPRRGKLLSWVFSIAEFLQHDVYHLNKSFSDIPQSEKPNEDCPIGPLVDRASYPSEQSCKLSWEKSQPSQKELKGWVVSV